ncbi:MAG: NAD(P)H-dependent oxidoreductase [Desulfobacterales bacterium]|nr:NAD(P)H-dependent oxidoreductase [Desulfobacterales bacterium]
MSKLIYIESSPRKERSSSIKITNAFLDAYKKTHPQDEVDKLDLWATKLPPFDGDTIKAKYQILHGLEHTPEEATAWREVVAIFDRFSRADKYVFSVPMWNFGIPYQFKHYIDIITQPGLSFSFSPQEGYKGLVTGKLAVVLYARGGEYSSNDTVGALDFQKPYVEMWLGFIGFSDIRSIVIEPTLSAPETVQKNETETIKQAVDLAKSF